MSCEAEVVIQFISTYHAKVKSWRTCNMYLGLASTMKISEKMIRHGNDRSHILILDDSDINSFFMDIEQLLFNMMFPKGRGNFGSTELCNFQCHRPDQKFGTFIRDICISSMAHWLDSRRERGNIQANLLYRKLPSILSVSCFFALVYPQP